MHSVSAIVLPVFSLILLGWTVKKTGLVDDRFFQQANGLLFTVCLPALLFDKIGSADFMASFNPRLIMATSLGVALVFGLSYLHGRSRGFPAAMHGVFCQGAFRGNLAYIGLAIIANAYGDTGLARAGILLGFLVPVLNFFAILALTLPHRGRGTSLLSLTTTILANPLIIASLAGIGWSLGGLTLPVAVARSLHLVSSMTLPLALLAIGGAFSLTRLRGDIGAALGAVLYKLILLPLITAVLLFLLGVRGLDFGIGLLMAGAPTAVATHVMADRMDGDSELAATIVVLATSVSALSYWIMLWFLLPHPA